MKKIISIMILLLCSISLPLINTYASTEEESIIDSSLEDDSSLFATDPSKPVIKGYDIATGNDKCLTQDELKAQFIYSDDTTAIENIRFEIRADAYTPSYNVVGKYKVTGKIWDEDDNSSSTSFYVTVVDVIPPVIYLDDTFVQATSDADIEVLNIDYVNDYYDMSLRVKRYNNSFFKEFYESFCELMDLLALGLFGDKL